MSKVTFNMRLKILYIKQILILFCLIISFQQEIICQGTDISKTRNPSLFVGLSLGPAQSYIKNNVTTSAPNLISDKKSSFLGFIEIGYFFSNYFGLSSGIGFISNQTQLTLKSYQNKFTTTDSENESYERRVTGSDIKELQKVGSLCLPFYINLRLPVSEKAGFFLQTGLSITVPLNKTYISSGTFTYKGYYSAYNVELSNLPAYGFPSDAKIATSGELKLNHLNFNAAVTAGVDFFIKENMQIALAGCYDKTLSNISNYSSPDKFQLSTPVNQINNQINSLMGGSTKATVQSIGLKISLRYYLK
jgi:Outer membrane protein beta-barrel domain